MDGNSPTHNREMKRNSSIFLAAVVAANVGYFGWRWVAHESYEDCLKKAAQAANGVSRAYADLRDICDDRELARMAERLPAEKPTAQAGLFDDLIPTKPPAR